MASPQRWTSVRLVPFHSFKVVRHSLYGVYSASNCEAVLLFTEAVVGMSHVDLLADLLVTNQLRAQTCSPPHVFRCSVLAMNHAWERWSAVDQPQPQPNTASLHICTSDFSDGFLEPAARAFGQEAQGHDALARTDLGLDSSVLTPICGTAGPTGSPLLRGFLHSGHAAITAILRRTSDARLWIRGTGPATVVQTDRPARRRPEQSVYDRMVQVARPQSELFSTSWTNQSHTHNTPPRDLPTETGNSILLARRTQHLASDFDGVLSYPRYDSYRRPSERRQSRRPDIGYDPPAPGTPSPFHLYVAYLAIAGHAKAPREASCMHVREIPPLASEPADDSLATFQRGELW